MSEKELSGIVASWGIVIGEVKIYKQPKIEIEKRQILDNEINNEIIRFNEVIEEAKIQLLNIKKEVSEKYGEKEAEIFNTQLLVLQDPVFYVEVINKIKRQKYNVEWIVQDELKTIFESFTSLQDPYMRERASDIYDIGNRILKLLTKQNIENYQIFKNKIIVAENLTPSDTIKLINQNIKGIITEKGGKNSHAAIMASSLKIPAIIGIKKLLDTINDGDTIILNAIHGKVIINPEKNTISRYTKIKKKFDSIEAEILKNKDLECKTKDNKKIIISANIGLLEELPTLNYYGADGIGLLRTEFLYMDRITMPLEEEQFNAYKKIVHHCFPNKVVIRTLDIGGDKLISIRGLNYSPEISNLLGIRGIRLSLRELDYFKQQIKAILRASIYGNVYILLPMVSVVEELLQFKTFIEEIKYEMKKQVIPFNENIKIGVMIEIPSAVWLAEEFAKECDFLSIGTNDLLQYTFAVSRDTEELGYLLKPRHSVLLNAIKYIVESAHIHKKPVSVCGEMANSLVNSILLVGLDVDELSMTPMYIPDIKALLRNINYKEAKQIVNEILKLKKTNEIEKYIKEKVIKYIKMILPEISEIRDENVM
ncbi:MAG TPA: phosphoenolpyruvate--protein phosphotransferase [bacterium]|nr:phosphoenolpyruvate--protein phosphotransferase [bacterium]